MKRKALIQASRAGVAPLEFVLGWPLLVTLMLLLWTVVQAGQTATLATVEAQRKAWAQRHSPTAAGRLPLPGASAVGRILLPNRSSSADSGLVSGEHRQALPWLPPFLAHLPDEAGAEHVLFTGTWDHSQLEFEPGPREHRALELSKRAEPFVGFGFDRAAFRRLLLP